MKKLLTILFTLLSVTVFSQGITVTVGGVSTTAENSDSLGGKGASFYVDTLNNQNIGGLKVFKDDLVLDSTLGIGGTPDPSAILHIRSTTTGILIPQMTNIERDLILNPAPGLEIYSTTNNVHNFFNGTAWKKVVFTPANTLNTIGALAFVIDTGEVHGDSALIWDSIIKRLDIGAASSITTLNVTGLGGASVGGFPSGALQITSPSLSATANAVITGHNPTTGQIWYFGSASSGNLNITALNRQLGDFAFGTNNITRLTIEAAGNVIFEEKITIKGGGPGVGKVLTSDAVGAANWTLPSGGGWTDSGTELILTNINDNVAIGNSTTGNQKLVVRGTSFGATGDGTELIEFRDDRTTTGSAPNYVLAVNRQNSTTAAWYLGNDGNGSPIIAGNNRAIRFGNDVSGTFTETMNLSITGALSGLTNFTVDNVNINGNLLSTSTGDFDITTGAGGVFKFNDDAIFAGLDGANQLEVGHGGSNAFINNTGAGDTHMRWGGITKLEFKSIGHIHLLSDVDEKHNITVRTANNLLETGFAFQNSGLAYTTAMYRKDIGSNRADFFFDIGQNTNIDLLTSAIRLHGSVADEGKVEVLEKFQISGTATAPGVGKVLTSDATGNATWETIGGGDIEGQYSGLNNQTPTTTTPIVLTFEAEDITEKGITHSTTVNPGEFTATIAKTYTWQIGPQWQKLTAAGTDTLDFFVELDTGSGFVKIANSNVKVISDSKSSDVIFLSASIPMAVGDKVRFMFRSSNPPNLQTTFFAATSDVPATPSQILNVFSGN